MNRTSYPSTTSPIGLVVALIVAISLAPAAAPAADRLRMVDNGSTIGVKDCVRAAADALAREDVDAFVECFTSDQRTKLRRRAAVVFVTHQVALDLVDSHVVSEEENRAEVAVKYRVVLSDDTFDIVSILRLVREEGEWRIARERIEATTRVRSDCSSGNCGRQVFRFGGGGDGGIEADVPLRRGGCANGQCGL